MKWPHASLTDQQVRNTFFVVPEIDYLFSLVLGQEGYRQFKAQRQTARAFGGDLLLIGWPDGMSITYHSSDPAHGIDVETLVETYRASAAMYRITKLDTAK
jgi:hypothetical protein